MFLLRASLSEERNEVHEFGVSLLYCRYICVKLEFAPRNTTRANRTKLVGRENTRGISAMPACRRTSFPETSLGSVDANGSIYCCVPDSSSFYKGSMIKILGVCFHTRKHTYPDPA